VMYANDVLVNNNLLFDNGSLAAIQGNSTATNVTEDYNIYDVSPSQVGMGGHSLLISSTAGLVVDAAGGNFHLPLGSLAISSGVNLAASGFATDIAGIKRQPIHPWDIGAYAFVSVAPSTPTNLRIIVP